MNSIVPLRGGAVSNVFRSRNDLPDLTGNAQQGIQASFAALGYKGKNWRIVRGEEEILFDDRGTPLPELNVVVVGISPNISKNYYEKRYAEGDSEAPDCFSTDGKYPDAAARNKQCHSCDVCPQNAWGSRITDSGKKAKACMDSRRVAVVPSGDVYNTNYGGPMMLRVPPTSLVNLAKYGTELSRLGYQPYMVETKLKFDYTVAYPLITFTASALLSDEQAQEVMEVLDDPLINRMLQQEARQSPQPEPQQHIPPRSAFGGRAPVVEASDTPPPVPPFEPRPPVVPPAPTAPEPVEIPPPPPPAPVPVAPATTPVVGKKSAFTKAKVAAKPAETTEPLDPPIAPTLKTLPTSMEDAIANLLKAPSLPVV